MGSTGSALLRFSPPQRHAIWGLVSLALAAAVYALFAAVQVSGTTAVERNCGSVFDSIADRSGWELWWALDVDDPDDEVRSSLLRTTQCPDSVNRQLAVVVVLGAAGLAGAAALRTPRPQPVDGSLGSGLVRLGRATSVVAAALGLAGVAGIIILIADADSTLFLYTDRVVVAVIGLVVLVPTLALYAIGRVLVLAGPSIDRADHSQGTGAGRDA